MSNITLRLHGNDTHPTTLRLNIITGVCVTAMVAALVLALLIQFHGVAGLNGLSPPPLYGIAGAFAAATILALAVKHYRNRPTYPVFHMTGPDVPILKNQIGPTDAFFYSLPEQRNLIRFAAKEKDCLVQNRSVSGISNYNVLRFLSESTDDYRIGPAASEAETENTFSSTPPQDPLEAYFSTS